jgi:hypothetical protein
MLTRRSFVRSVAAGGLGASAAVAFSERVSAQDASTRTLVGTWMVTSTRGAVANGVLVTVFPDGSFIRTGIAHATETPGHGVWRQVDDRVYEVTYLAIQLDGSGAFAGHRKSWLRISLDADGNSFDGLTRGAALDVNGVETDLGDGAIRGVRMVVEPFAQ